jgi:hypothetical protein
MKSLSQKLNKRIQQIEEEIGNEVSEGYQQEIFETIKELGGDEHSFNGSAVPVGKKYTGARWKHNN